MRTDVKIVAVIAIVLVVVFVVWLVIPRGGTDEPTPGSGDAAVDRPTPAAEEPTNEIVVEVPPPAPEPEPLRPRYLEPPVRREGGPDLAVTPPPAPPLVIEPAPIPPVVEEPTPRRLTPEYGSPYRTEPVVPTINLATGKDYVIQQGDSYWTIAQREYGDGTLFKTIQDANPTMPPNALRPGKTIKVPPKPAASSTPTTPTATGGAPAGVAASGEQPGTVRTDPLTGKRYYIVKKGDAGFWGIAQTVYGKGTAMNTIAKANPSVSATRLREGMKLWIPSELVEAEGPPPTGTGTGTATAVRPAPTRPAPAVEVRTGAPTRETLPDGRLFD